MKKEKIRHSSNEAREVVKVDRSAIEGYTKKQNLMIETERVKEYRDKSDEKKLQIKIRENLNEFIRSVRDNRVNNSNHSQRSKYLEELHPPKETISFSKTLYKNSMLSPEIRKNLDKSIDYKSKKKKYLKHMIDKGSIQNSYTKSEYRSNLSKYGFHSMTGFSSSDPLKHNQDA